jgi:hypothetical protein
MRTPTIESLTTVTLSEARAYVAFAGGDELRAAVRLAEDRSALAGEGPRVSTPDETEVHHALFLLRRARGQAAPSFDSMRIDLRKKLAA